MRGKYSMNEEHVGLMQAMLQYERRLRELPYDKLPLEICLGENLTLSHWSLIVTDRCLFRIVDDYKKRRITDSVKSIDLSFGNNITDIGLCAVTDAFSQLSTATLENLFQITANGLLNLVKSCRNVCTVSLSGCLGISGAGFAIFGQYSHQLKSLKLSGCPQVTTWAFMKIFEGCTKLKELDVSYCSLLTDQELKLLSDNCQELMYLNLKDCQQVSDVGIFSLSQGCKHIARLNLARSGLVSKITDVSLLAIGRGCKDLYNLNLSGCEMITDAGISWLVKGCPKLNYMNISNCIKVTNGGMRCLGEECKLLKTVVLTNAKNISDIGLRYLAEGCYFLEHINDGSTRNFSLEGIQSIGKSKCGKTLKKINFHGCFQLSRIALKSVSEMRQLEVLGLSSCTDLSFEGMSLIVRSCPNIFSLSLASCGDCVTNTMLENITQHLCALKILNLMDCGKIGRRGLKGVSRCTFLSYLNLSGCSGVTNDAILALCSGTLLKLSDLYLDRCHKVSNTALAWITDGLKDSDGIDTSDVTLVKLSLRGTKISLSGARAIREHFRYSTLKSNDTFFGFFALPRSGDRKIIFKYRKTFESAVTIQATVRARKDKDIVKRARDKFHMLTTATKIAALWRGRCDRIFAKQCRYERWLCRIMVIKLQCFFRAFQSKKRLQKLKDRRWAQVSPYASTKIQRVYRGKKGRKRALRFREAHLQMSTQKRKACIKIQVLFRVHITAKLMWEFECQKVSLENKRRQCCLKIQSCWRTRLAVHTSGKILELKYFQKKIEKQASNKISKCFKSYQFRQILSQRISFTELLKRSALQIQVWFRDITLAFQLQSEDAKRLQEIRKVASIYIQKSWKRKAAYKTVKQLQRHNKELNIQKREKSIILTTWVRVYQARYRVKEIRKIHQKERIHGQKLELWASIRIASYWRGYKGRVRSHLAIKAKKSRWKEMWSDKEQRCFYYNQITGESRWSKPQDLLDLEVRPICNNCEYYNAQIECADCHEYFCSTCWDAVHFGGSRKGHEFRSLYDFYDKRVDYGDSEFPSRWPTEVEQDDKLGWQLRIEPYRSPSRQENEWNIYHDSATKRNFYHDDRTDKVVYNTPLLNNNK